MRLNGIIGAEIPYYKMMNKAMPGPAKDTKRKPKNGRLALEVLGGKLARNRNVSRSKILKEVLH